MFESVGRGATENGLIGYLAKLECDESAKLSVLALVDHTHPTARRGSVTAATDEIDNWLLGAHTHGFNVPQIGEHQLFREELSDSVQQARALREEMAILRENEHIALTKLTDKITALKKSCGKGNLSQERKPSRIKAP